MADLPGRRHFRLAGPRRARARRPAGRRLPRPSCSATSTSSACWWPVDARPPRSSPTRWSRCAPARWARSPADATLLRGRRWPTGSRELDFELPLAGGDDAAYPAATCGSATWRRCCAGTCPRATRCRAYADALDADAGLGGQPLRGYLTGSIDVVLRVPTSRAGTRYLDRRLQDQLAGRAGRAADRRTTTARRRSTEAMGALRLPAPGAALRRRAAPLPALAAARLRPGAPTSAACSTSTCAACAGRRRRGSTGSRAASSPGGRRSRSSRSCRTCSDGRPPVGSAAMSEIFETVDAHDARLALRRHGLLADFNAAGVLKAADVHVATTPRRRSAARSRRAGAARRRARRAGGARRLGLPRPRRRCRRARRRRACPGPSRPPGPGRVGAPARCVAPRGAALGARAALPRPLPRAGDPGARRPARARPRSRRRRRRARLLAAALDRVFAPTRLRRAARGLPCGAAAQWTTVLTGGPAPARPRRSRGCWRCSPSRPHARGERLRDRAGRADRQGRGPAAGGGAASSADAARPSRPGPARPGCTAMTLHRLLAPAPGQPHPLPAPPRQPAAARRGRRRRDLDGRR